MAPDDPATGEPQRDADVTAVSALGEPSRRALYEFVTDAGTWTSRDQAAEATGLERATAAHHLDRLAAEGLLEVEFQRLTGRTGPGAGRPSKVYRRAQREVSVFLPPRRYEVAGRMLAAAADRSRLDGSEIADAIDVEARNEGRRLSEQMRARLQGPSARQGARRRQAVVDVLADYGYEPQSSSDGTTVLRNCPFHHLAREHTELICGMNLQLIEEAVEAVGRTGLQATLDPRDGRCCVRLDT